MNDNSWRRLMTGNLVVLLDASPTALLRRIRRREGARDGLPPPNIRPLADVAADARRWPRPARRRVLELLEARLPRYRDAPVAVLTTGRGQAAVARQVARLAREAGLGR
jgi:shikimate kinase